MKCRRSHEILLVEEFNALGAVVSCLRCKDTFQIRDDTLNERYYHFHHVSPGPNGEGDRDLFLADFLMEGQ